MDRTKKGIIFKTLDRCRSIGRGKKNSFDESLLPYVLKKVAAEKTRVVPEGYLTVCVGSEKEKFLIKMDYVNHSRFKTLLDEAEMEYGYTNDGPLVLPCDINFFQGLLWEIEQDFIRPGCKVTKGGVYQLLSPARTPMIYRAQRC
ncbi:auxin-responsive protein SAUR50-like [Wolffia australiana]